MHIENQIKEFVLKNFLFVQSDSLNEDTSFLETGVVDSTGVMELVAFVEVEWGITVETDELTVENFDSARKLACFVRRKRSLPQVDGSASQPPIGGGASPLHRADESTF